MLASGEFVRLIERCVISDALARRVYDEVMMALTPDCFVKPLLTASEEQRFAMLLPQAPGGRVVTFYFIKLFFEVLHPERLETSGRAMSPTASVGV